MSFNAMSWAAGLKLKCYEKLVLLMLANRANPATNCCFPSIRVIAEDCGISQAQARKAIVSLEKMGLVQRTGQMKSYGQTSNMFTLFVGKTPTLLERPPTLLECHKLLPLNRSPVSLESSPREGLIVRDSYIGTAKSKMIMN